MVKYRRVAHTSPTPYYYIVIFAPGSNTYIRSNHIQSVWALSYSRESLHFRILAGGKTS